MDMYITIMSTHISMHIIVVRMADRRSVHIVEASMCWVCRGMVATPARGTIYGTSGGSGRPRASDRTPAHVDGERMWHGGNAGEGCSSEPRVAPWSGGRRHGRDSGSDSH